MYSYDSQQACSRDVALRDKAEEKFIDTLTSLSSKNFRVTRTFSKEMINYHIHVYNMI